MRRKTVEKKKRLEVSFHLKIFVKLSLHDNSNPVFCFVVRLTAEEIYFRNAQHKSLADHHIT